MIDELAWKVLSYGDDLHLQLWRMGKVAPQRFDSRIGCPAPAMRSDPARDPILTARRRARWLKAS
jgi:hypothetical protein